MNGNGTDRAELGGLDEAFTQCSGRARIRIGEELDGFDEELNEVFIKRYGAPTNYLPRYNASADSTVAATASCTATNWASAPRLTRPILFWWPLP